MWEQNETGSEREFPEDVRPAVLGWLGRLGYDPELALRMVNDGDSLAGGGADRPTATQKIDLVISVDAAPQVDRQM